MVVIAAINTDARLADLSELERNIQKAYFRMEEAQGQRIRMMRIWHPELMTWAKKGLPPQTGETKQIKNKVLDEMGLGPDYYERMVVIERDAKSTLETLAQQHPLWGCFKNIKGFGPYLCGAFIAAGGDVRRCATVSSFWKGMGLDLNPDGTVPRRIRGRKEVERKIPCLPHVSRIGEQIRQQMIRSGGRTREWYDLFRAQVDAKHPDRVKIWNFKGAQRLTQKLLYSCLWAEWRRAYGLPAPEPYAFAILRHANPAGEPDPAGRLVTIEDFYDRS